MAQQQTNHLRHVRLNIAVTGEAGVGKSTFINTIRGLKDGDKGAAVAGVTETTKDPTPYSHHQMPNVTFWDMPGMGTTICNANKYLQYVKCDNYDFFIIVSSIFKENDLNLAKEIRERNKQFYFVRSKIDLDIYNESTKASFNKGLMLRTIREQCKNKLRGTGEPKIFLISCKNECEFDFKNLVATLKSELPQLKRSALHLTLTVGSMAELEGKIEILKIGALPAATASGAIAAVPVPGLSLATDAGILVSFFTKCYYTFGLDDKSIEKLSNRVNKPHLTTLRMSPIVAALASGSAMRLALSLLAGEEGVESLCRFIPVVGSVVAAGISFGLTYRLLIKGLEELADAARAVLIEAEIQ